MQREGAGGPAALAAAGARVTIRYPYDARRDPPAPVVPIRVGFPGQRPEVLLLALVDTGADLSVVPSSVGTC